MNYLNGTKLDNRHIRLQVDKVRAEVHFQSGLGPTAQRMLHTRQFCLVNCSCALYKSTVACNSNTAWLQHRQSGVILPAWWLLATNISHLCAVYRDSARDASTAVVLLAAKCATN